MLKLTTCYLNGVGYRVSTGHVVHIDITHIVAVRVVDRTERRPSVPDGVFVMVSTGLEYEVAETAEYILGEITFA